MLAVVVSVIAGVTIVMNRMVNAELAKKIGNFQSTLFNYITGLGTSLVFWWISGEYLGLSGAGFAGIPFWAYMGGLMGVVVVALSNYVTPRISAFYLTLLIFSAQILTGCLIDFLATDSFSLGKLLGGILVLAGLVQNLRIDYNRDRNPDGDSAVKEE